MPCARIDLWKQTKVAPLYMLAPRTTYEDWRTFFSSRPLDVLLRQRLVAPTFDKFVCNHFSRALSDELEARTGRG